MIKRLIIVSVIMIAGLSMVALSTRTLASDNGHSMKNLQLDYQFEAEQ